MKTLLLDVDGVIADCASAVHNWAGRRFGREFAPPASWETYDFATNLSLSSEEASEFYRKILNSKIPRSIHLYPDAEASVKALKQHFDVVFVTSHWRKMPDWVYYRDELLEPFDCDIVYTHNKSRVVGDILCDDKASILEAGGPWKGVLFNRPWNRHSVYDTRIDHLWELIGYAETPARLVV